MQEVEKDRRLGNLSTPNSVRKLRRALHVKAKAEPDFRFYALYDKLYREDILNHAYRQCRANRGAPGIDGQDFADVEAYGVERWLGELAFALREETYQPDAIRRVYIPKANGKLRPLGISTLKDRVCMTAAMLVLEPIFEADLPPEMYPTDRGAMRSRRWSRCKNRCTVVTQMSLMLIFLITLAVYRTRNCSSRWHVGMLIDGYCTCLNSGLNDLLKKSIREVERRVLPRLKIVAAVFRRVLPSHHYWRIFICAGFF